MRQVVPKLKSSKKTTTKGRSLRQENRLAKARGGSRVPASGAIQGLPGDVREKDILWEAKTTQQQSYRVTLPVLEKITMQALEFGREPAMLISFEGDLPVFVPKDWALVPLSVLPRGMRIPGRKLDESQD